MAFVGEVKSGSEGAKFPGNLILLIRSTRH
jgi:hypothetical protein